MRKWSRNGESLSAIRVRKGVFWAHGLNVNLDKSRNVSLVFVICVKSMGPNLKVDGSVPIYGEISPIECVMFKMQNVADVYEFPDSRENGETNKRNKLNKS